MKKVTLGNTGVDVSALCLGCMYFGTRNDKSSSYQLLDQYFEAGGRFLDTANNYAFWIEGFQGGESETLLGQWMKDRKNRDKIFLATKVGGKPTVPDGGLESSEGLSANAIEKGIDESLRRLQVDSVDLYYSHILDANTPLDETLEAFDKVVKAGKVRHIGCSNLRAWRVERAKQISLANQWAEYSCIQQRYSYLRPKPAAKFVDGLQICVNDDLLEFCADVNMPILAYSPLLSGAYTREDRPLPEEYNTPDTDMRLAALKTVAQEVGATLNQVVLAWMMQSHPTIIPIIAASTPEQMHDNLGTLNITLSKEQMALLADATG